MRDQRGWSWKGTDSGTEGDLDGSGSPWGHGGEGKEGTITGKGKLKKKQRHTPNIPTPHPKKASSIKEISPYCTNKLLD